MASFKYETILVEEKDVQGGGDYDEDGESGIDECYSDDSEEDPTYDILEETRSGLSNLSIKKSKSRVSKAIDSGTRLNLSKNSIKKSKPRVSKAADSGSDEEMENMEVEVPELDEKDEKCFEKVEGIIKAGQLEKLKVEQCKVYLRKYGLRLTGKKDVLIERIREHLGVIDGKGEEKYPISSFVLNCKGDACTGDVVMFEQNVYEMYSIVSRSATAPACGTRIVVGRIVKESYGAAKQQHTFTIEVLWSKGVKPLPPLHPLLIKGRNLYRLKTVRQKWTDEEERRKALHEKHSRGSLARCSRETRVQHKEMRKMRNIKRIMGEESGGIQEKSNAHQLNPVGSDLQRNIQYQQHPNISTSIIGEQNIHHQPNIPHQQCPNSTSINIRQHSTQHPQNPIRSNDFRQPNIHHHQHPNIRSSSGSSEQRNYSSTVDWQHFSPKRNGCILPRPHPTSNGFSYRQPLMTLNSSSVCFPRPMQRRPCHFYPQGRCRFGDTCKYLHE
ncbi:uncharacterized protein LOC143876842 [Tasmannia lanceolata]|uniref:uncharacterized protein LOC143876842 n=1 Tax=Tasmannia lanceolata TaxID=3420 RepID=UPI0040628D5A